MALTNLIAPTPVGPPQRAGAPTQQVNQYGFVPTQGANPAWALSNTQPINPDSVNAGIQNSIQAMLAPDSQYIQNARQRGMEQAAARGGINSSIAAGASERAAMEAADPYIQQSIAATVGAQTSDWLQAQNFNRQFQAELAMMPVTNAANMLNMVMQQSLQDPELYTPEVISGYTNFFNENMKNLFSNYGFGRTA